MAVWLYGRKENDVQSSQALAVSFTRRVPARDRSRYIAEALTARLAERERLVVIVPLITSPQASPPLLVEVRSVGTPAVAVLDQLLHLLSSAGPDYPARASFAITVQSLAPYPRAIRSSIFAAIAGRARRSTPPRFPSSTISCTSLRAIVSSHDGCS